MVKRSFIADCENLPIIRNFIEVSIHELGGEPSVIDGFVQAVDEAVTNIIIHGYAGMLGYIEIEIRLIGDSIVTYLRDQAPFFDPTRVPAPDLMVPLEDRTPGGCGIYIIKYLMDKVEYRPLSPKGNELILHKSTIKEVKNGV